MTLLKFNIKYKTSKHWLLFHVKSYEKMKSVILNCNIHNLRILNIQKNNKFSKIENLIYRIVRWFNLNPVHVKLRVLAAHAYIFKKPVRKNKFKRLIELELQVRSSKYLIHVQSSIYLWPMRFFFKCFMVLLSDCDLIIN